MAPVRSFWDIYDEFTEDCGRKNDWTPATYGKFNALKNHLSRFKKVNSFDFFTEKGLSDLVDFFRNKCSMLNSTIGKQLGYLKWFLRWAANKGYNQNLAYTTFVPKLKQTQSKVIFLTDEELEQLKAYQIPPSKGYLEKSEGCVRVLLLHRSMLFRCRQSETE